MARLAAAVLACGLLLAGAVREDLSRLQNEVSQEQLLKMVRDLQGRVASLEGNQGSASKSDKCCSIENSNHEHLGYCKMAKPLDGCSSTNKYNSYRVYADDDMCLGAATC
mmetsp:Transcript_141750/g.200770  ORF Transcript_141750/g.200770 Transcript_141750/m.200770 type:complete len:110 (+) Transcript_141750:69-398(+)